MISSVGIKMWCSDFNASVLQSFDTGDLHVSSPIFDEPMFIHAKLDVESVMVII